MVRADYSLGGLGDMRPRCASGPTVMGERDHTASRAAASAHVTLTSAHPSPDILRPRPVQLESRRGIRPPDDRGCGGGRQMTSCAVDRFRARVKQVYEYHPGTVPIEASGSIGGDDPAADVLIGPVGSVRRDPVAVPRRRARWTGSGDTGCAGNHQGRRSGGWGDERAGGDCGTQGPRGPGNHQHATPRGRVVDDRGPVL